MALSMRFLFPCVLTALLTLASSSQANPSLPRTLDIYFIDVEGGAATLIVTPQGESLLMDCGWKRDDRRDAKRIYYVATKLAGLPRIDYFIGSHFHTDHFGAIGQLNEMIPIRSFYDHAVMKEPQEYDKELYPEYQKVSTGKRQTFKAGDIIPLKQGKTSLKIACVVSDGQVVGKPVGTGVGSNLHCGDVKLQEEDTSDNAKSIGILLSYGKFDFLNNGDLTWNIEHKLVCPQNYLGIVDLYMVTHHGMNISNNPALVRAIQPTVSVMCNGPRKGGHPDTVRLLKGLPSLKAAYQLHRNVETSQADNTDRSHIANWDENCQGQFIKASVAPDGDSFTVTFGERGTPSTFQAR